jgi:hypothetical protein
MLLKIGLLTPIENRLSTPKSGIFSPFKPCRGLTYAQNRALSLAVGKSCYKTDSYLYIIDFNGFYVLPF